MRIRRLRKEDATEVSNIIRRCLREVNSKDYPKKVITSLYDFFTPDLIIKNMSDRTIYVAVEKDKIIGTASLKEDTVFTVFVNPDLHGKGIGSKLMDKVEELAKKEGYQVLKVPSGLSSVEFYKHRGYKEVKRVHSVDHGDTIEMEKRL
ncbi:MAG: GNAT family N-acetyltransferase [Candidatus Woesearchaeota archaeon]|jgi:GNAT superfamily N-acetyltransferase